MSPGRKRSESSGAGRKADDSRGNSMLRLAASVLHDISRASVSVKEVPTFLRNTLDILNARMNLTRGTITLRNGDMLVIIASHGLSEDERKRGVYRMGEGVTGDVAKRGVSRVVPDISKSPDFLNRTMSRDVGHTKTAFICVPISTREGVIGTLSIDRENPDRESLNRCLKLLETVANVIAEAVSVLYLDMAENERLDAQNRELRSRIESELRPENAIGSCAAMLKVYEQIAQAGASDMHVMIRGEVGAGKDFAMRAITNSPKWRGRPVEILNCAAMHDSTIEAQLFGLEKNGTITEGVLEKIGSGTVYLDAMGLIGQALQLKLLRLLRDGIYRRVGGERDLHSSARIITSTCGDLESRLRDNIIRQDFYYQLTRFTISIPPLRKRRRDIPALAKYFLQKYARLHDKKVTTISAAAANMISAYHWPSNVRELENCIERAVLISADRTVSESDLPPSLQTPQSTNTSKLRADLPIDFEKLVGNFEREIIVEVLAAHGGNAAAAARHLSVSRRILNYKIAKLGISPKVYKQKHQL